MEIPLIIKPKQAASPQPPISQIKKLPLVTPSQARLACTSVDTVQLVIVGVDSRQRMLNPGNGIASELGIKILTTIRPIIITLLHLHHLRLNLIY